VKGRLKAGDLVEVKNPQQIARTLDPNGTLDGLPFMPEMLEYCGRRSQIQRIAEKTCVEFSDRYRIRQFRRNDVLILGSLRCLGRNHDGCGRACVLFCKADWLRKVDSGPPEREESVSYQRTARRNQDDEVVRTIFLSVYGTVQSDGTDFADRDYKKMLFQDPLRKPRSC
jgi:hypothetical protein